MEAATTRGNSKRFRCSYEYVLTILLIVMAAALWAVNISAVSLEGTAFMAAGMITPPATSRTTSAKPDSLVTSNRKIPNKDPLLEILRLANIHNLTSQEWESLPSWQQVVQRFGDRPRFIGLDTCEAYRSNVPPNRRIVGPSGMFNTGTNLLFQLLERNCQVHPAGRRRDGHTTNEGVLWQVNWGKHQYPRFRYTNQVRNANAKFEVLPVVMVRDPWTWFQSLCKVRYSAHWFHCRCSCYW